VSHCRRRGFVNFCHCIIEERVLSPRMNTRQYVFLEMKQCHVTLAVIERHPDGTYVLKALKQKQCIDGLCYLLQEVYGIENKTVGGTEVRRFFRVSLFLLLILPLIDKNLQIAKQLCFFLIF
jgi:hypothetical protein